MFNLSITRSKVNLSISLSGLGYGLDYQVL